jgi:hypothetical protein
MSRRWPWLATAVLVSLAGCIPSNVVAHQDRMVTNDLDRLQFLPMPAVELRGFYESVAVRGPVAASLRKVYYWFEASGRYTAAALIEGPDGLGFQTLDGSFLASPAGLALDGGEAVPLERAGEYVRLASPEGELLLRRGILQ